MLAYLPLPQTPVITIIPFYLYDEKTEGLTACFQRLHLVCADELNRTLTISPLNQFSEFPSTSTSNNYSPMMVKGIENAGNEWIIITSIEKHYLRPTPNLLPFPFMGHMLFRKMG